MSLMSQGFLNSFERNTSPVGKPFVIDIFAAFLPQYQITINLSQFLPFLRLVWNKLFSLAENRGVLQYGELIER